jgi:hypothetical protein
MTIKSLTTEQEATFSKFREKWLSIGLSTDRIDYKAAIDATLLAYEKAGVKAPRFFMFPNGPNEALDFLAAAPFCELTESDFVELSSKSPLALTEAIRVIVEINSEKIAKNKKIIWPGFYGQGEAGWLSFHDFFSEHFNLSELSAGLRELAKHSGWVWMYEDIVIISQKPIRVTMNSNNVLHNEKQAAVEYADGTKVYSFNGVAIPENWVLERETMNPAEILQCPDTDKRAAGLALYGYNRLKGYLNYKIIEGDPTTDIGALIEIKIPGLTRPGRFLEAVCPRNGPVFLGVPTKNPWDNNKPIETAVGAQAFLARLPESAYEHPPIRT